VNSSEPVCTKFNLVSSSYCNRRGTGSGLILFVKHAEPGRIVGPEGAYAALSTSSAAKVAPAGIDTAGEACVRGATKCTR
jgi:hypothetical protein